MPIYLDRHEDLGGLSAVEMAAAHMRDLAIQDSYGVKYLTYWFDHDKQKSWCLVDAPSAEVAASVHAEAHGALANRVILADPEMVHRYLGEDPVDEPPAWNPDGVSDPTLRTILFTDIVGSTAAGNRLGDDAALAMVRAHNEIVREQLAAIGGREVKHTGDGIMASFESVTRAIECSMAIQRALQERNLDPAVEPVHVRIGLAAGEPITEDEDLFGTAVNLAARICDAAEPGSVYVSNVVRELSIGKKYEFEHVAELVLKGFPEPIAVARVVA
jgi:class 3 adenylate cyclase